MAVVIVVMTMFIMTVVFYFKEWLSETTHSSTVNIRHLKL